MILADAQAALQRVLDPLPVDRFLDEVLGQGFIKVEGGDADHRRTLLGPDPAAVILDAFDRLAPKITCHAERPRGQPPRPAPVPDAAAFKATVDAHHALGWTVRVPEVHGLTPQLAKFIRALEVILHQPVEAAVFWSRGDGQAQVHYDEYDIIVIQLVGSKRWFINTDPPPLPNPWRGIAEGPPALDPHTVVEVAPGDLLYLPCGTAHRVDALSDALHVSIGFRPLTLRETIIAALDHMSDLDRRLRVGVGNRLGLQVHGNSFGDLPGQVRGALGQLLELCRSDAFVGQALQRRSSRAVSKLERLEQQPAPSPLTLASRLRRHPLAVGHLIGNAERLDFSHPGGHIHIHRGAEAAVVFIAGASEFQVRDIPGEIGDDVRIALAQRFVDAGFLVAA
ncbi:ribosomal protein L16 Arg81 hydroxylase [Caulobacter ginsengisoli]|uniref:Ribosomal protein L16 Arg81 hydroxylase n=1 Tax=Caulobacter ginsengisoli TaxID=400775 RepID=A0ABU0IXQ7_9CAUL|nr:cupin domain-containing protein [Caulobacter ginsengisoli]MDQ0466796.1 ribosomal protein L16 Arg81 hydroxylase [Caulobacter ginsengisoli]